MENDFNEYFYLYKIEEGYFQMLCHKKIPSIYFVYLLKETTNLFYLVICSLS